jgi:transposase
MVFLDEMGLLLGCMRDHARSEKGSRVYDCKPFYRGKKVTVIGAISIDKVLGVMTMNDSMDSNAFNVYIENILVPQLWPGAVVMMDNLSAHKIDEITPIIESVGASVINISPYSPDFNPIEHWWSQLKSFIKTFSPRTTEMVNILIAVALHLVDSKYLRNWFANCCYCTS